MILNNKYKRLIQISSLTFKLQAVACILFLICSEVAHQSNTVAVVCGVIAIFISLLPIIYTIVYRDFTIILSCICVYNLAPIWFLYLESVLPGYDGYEYIAPEFRMTTIFWASLFQLIVNLLYTYWIRSLTIKSVRFYSFFTKIDFKPKTYIVTTFVMFAIPLVCFYIFYGSGEILWKALTAGRSGGGGTGLIIRDAKGGTSSYMLPFVWIWQLTPLLSSVAYINGRKLFPMGSKIALSMGLLVIFVFFLGGTRSALMQVAAPSLFYLFYYNWDKGLKFWLVAGSLFFVAIGIMELQVRFRGNLLDVLVDPTAAAKNRGLKSVTTFDMTESHRDNNFYILGLMVKSYPAKYKFEGFNDFFAVILNPIPRAIWPSKPLLGGAKEYSTLRAYIANGPLKMGTTSLTSTVIGNAYLSQGFWGIVVFASVYAAILAWFEGLMFYANRERVLIVGISGIAVFLSFWSFRGFFALVSFLYPFLLLTLTLKVISIKMKK